MKSHSTTQPSHGDKKSRSRWIPVVAIVLVVITALNVRKFVIDFEDHQWLQSQVQNKQQQLAALNKQKSVGKARLTELSASKGRDQLLVQHGYIAPNERILLFPPDPDQQRAASIPKNDLSPRPPSAEAGQSSASAWSQAANALGDFWRSVAGSSSDKSQEPSKSAGS